MIEKIREYISCPELSDDHYGRWGALNREQRLKIKELLDYTQELEDLVKPFCKYQKAILKITEVLDTKSPFIRKKKIKRILKEYYYD